MVEIVTKGWRVMRRVKSRDEKKVTIKPLSPRMYHCESTAREYCALAVKGGLDAFVESVQGVESSTRKSAKRK